MGGRPTAKTFGAVYHQLRIYGTYPACWADTPVFLLPLCPEVLLTLFAYLQDIMANALLAAGASPAMVSHTW